MERRTLAGTLEALIGECQCFSCYVWKQVLEELKVLGPRLTLSELDIMLLRYEMRAWDQRAAQEFARAKMDATGTGIGEEGID